MDGPKDGKPDGDDSKQDEERSEQGSAASTEDAGFALPTPIFLVAMPQVLDPFFHKSVVLLIQHQEEGSFGFVVNHPTDLDLDQVLEGLKMEWNGEPGAQAYCGGPVQRQLGSVIFRNSALDLGEDAPGPTPVEVSPGVMMTQHVGDLERLAAKGESSFRLLLGYAAWGSGQLTQEILRNDWITAPVAEELLFHEEPDLVWPAALASVGLNPEQLPSWTPAPGEDETLGAN